MKKLMNRMGLLAAAIALALAVVPALNAAAQAQASSAVGSATDGDGLIEITTPAQFNAMRYDQNGDGVPGLIASSAGYAGHLTCRQRATAAAGQTPPSCKGYELANDISLAGYPNRTPIPGLDAVFNGDGFNITGLTGNVGLFSGIGGDGVVKNLNVVDASITISGADNAPAGVLAAVNNGAIIGSYASGNVTVERNSAGTKQFSSLGGLVGANRRTGKIAASVADVNVAVHAIPDGTTRRVGGFVGINSGHIHGGLRLRRCHRRSNRRRRRRISGEWFRYQQRKQGGNMRRSRSYGDEVVKRPGEATIRALAPFPGQGTLITNSCALADESEVACLDEN